MSIILDGTNGVTYNDSSLQAAAASPYVLKNRIINGDMRIDQRNAGASITPNLGLPYTVDRWRGNFTQNTKFSIQQNAGSVTPPVGYKNYLGLTSTSAFSVGTSDYFFIEQTIEGFNIADLAWGTSDAKTVTLSFWVRSSLTGTFGGSLRNGSSNYNYLFTYSIPTANTWTQINLTITGATSGTWLTTNGEGVSVSFSLGAGATISNTAGSWVSGAYYAPTGATSVVGTNGATWYVTGVQLEVGSSATPFERRLYNQELANCQRYFKQYSLAHLGHTFTAQVLYTNGVVTFPVSMRTTPTLASGGVFAAVAGNNGTVGLGGNTSADMGQLYNTANNWTASTSVNFTGGFSAEL